MTIDKMLKEREKLLSLKEEYLNMIDMGCSDYTDLFTLYDLNDEIKSLTNRINNIIEYTVSDTAAGYIAGYRYYNGYRIVNVYVRTKYAGRYIFTLDHAHAKIYKSKQAAQVVAAAVSDQDIIINRG